jgi:hypothetical protein
MTIKIALIGSAPSSVRLAPYGSPDWQVWACSPGAWGALSMQGVNPLERVQVWWELHRYEPGQPWFSQEYCAFLARHPRVMMAEKRHEIPNSEALPVDELVAKYGPYFFTSSLAYMFAAAMEAGATTIGLWGVDMSATEEYALQRPALWYFGMLAKARGIEVGVPPESDLFRPPPLYGVSEIDHARIKFLARRRELEQRKLDAQNRINAATAEFQCLHGALDDLTYVENTWVGNVAGSYVEPPMVPAMAEVMRERAQ